MGLRWSGSVLFSRLDLPNLSYGGEGQEGDFTKKVGKFHDIWSFKLKAMQTCPLTQVAWELILQGQPALAGDSHTKT